MFSNTTINNWISHIIRLTKPKNIKVCDGSKEETDLLFEIMRKNGSVISLQNKSYLAFTDPSDVARVEKDTFICSESKINAGLTNNWAPPNLMRQELKYYFCGSMQDKSMYIIPFLMGPPGNPFSCKYGVQITDSPYVVENMKIMTKVGK